MKTNTNSKTNTRKRPMRRARTSLKHRPISRIAHLTRPQLDQLAAWHIRDGLSIEACATRASAEFNPKREIPKTSVQRFLEHRRRIAELLGDLDDALAAATEINQYAATGSTEFSPATLFFFEKQAFQIARHRKPGDALTELKDLFLLIHKAKTTAVRERLAKVQEDKRDLRAAELQFKKQLAEKREARDGSRLEESSDLEQSEIENQESEIPLEPFPSDETLARLGVKPEHLLPFGADYRKSICNAARIQSTTAEELLAGIVRDSKFRPQSPPTPTRIHSPRDPEVVSSESRSSASISAETDQSKIENLKSKIESLSPEALAAAVNAYTIRRAEEYWAHRRKYAHSGRKQLPPPYLTQYRHCPCGAASPCPVHENDETFGPFPGSFWTRSPHSMYYAECLRARDLPYREPTEFL